MFFKIIIELVRFSLDIQVSSELESGWRSPCTFWSFVKNKYRILQVFNKRDETIIINFENVADGNALFGKVKNKIINFSLFDTAIGLRVLEIAF